MSRKGKLFCVAIAIIAIGTGLVFWTVPELSQNAWVSPLKWILIISGVLVLLRSLTIPVVGQKGHLFLTQDRFFREERRRKFLEEVKKVFITIVGIAGAGIIIGIILFYFLVPAPVREDWPIIFLVIFLGLAMLFFSLAVRKYLNI